VRHDVDGIVLLLARFWFGLRDAGIARGASSG
jgi:hypothetical protein